MRSRILTALSIAVAMSLMFTTVVIPSESSADDSGLSFLYYPDGAIVAGTTYNMPADLVIPSSVTVNEVEYPVVGIRNSAFQYCTNLISVTIPDSVTSIGDGAFYGCTNLISVSMSDNVTSVGKNAFYQCSSLTSIAIPNGVTSIGDSTFWGCTNLTSVTIPDSVSLIGDGAFYQCSSLTSISISNRLFSIGKNAFYRCSSLTSVAIPNGVMSIGDGAFDQCSSLTSFTISDDATSIGSGAFSGCTNLAATFVVYGPLGTRAFADCTNPAMSVVITGGMNLGAQSFDSFAGSLVLLDDSINSGAFSNFQGHIFVEPESYESISDFMTRIGYPSCVSAMTIMKESQSVVCGVESSIPVPIDGTVLMADGPDWVIVDSSGDSVRVMATPPTSGTYAITLLVSTGSGMDLINMDIRAYPAITVSDMTISMGDNVCFTPVADPMETVTINGIDWLSVSGNVVSGVPPAIGTYTGTVSVGGGTESFTITVVSALAPSNTPTSGLIVVPR